jgi:hypothetical protein
VCVRVCMFDCCEKYGDGLPLELVDEKKKKINSRNSTCLYSSLRSYLRHLTFVLEI